MDPGEQHMFAPLLDDKGISRFITGDKVAMRAVATRAADSDELADAIARRAKWLESIFRGPINRFGFYYVHGRVSKA